MPSIPSPAWLLIAATVLPLVSFAILVFWGRKMGTPLAGVVGVVSIAASFVCSLTAMILWLGSAAEWGYERSAINVPFNWIPIGDWATQSAAGKGFLAIGVYVDSLTILMFNMVTLISTLIFIFSIGYMREDKRFPRFFTYLSLFCFSMLGLVLGGTILQLFIFWELVGLCSYLLIGFWYEKKSASNAAIKAFVVNRIGDFGFLIGFGILFYHLGNATLPDLWIHLGTAGTEQAATNGIQLVTGVTFTPLLLTIMGIGLFFGAVGKSAQFPLHVWLPDAMEGPTPVSALIHAATMVAAGVYLVGRIFPILTPDAKLFIAITGCVTLTMAALIALVQSDIKKVLAYSTLSQLGYMILAMGIGSWIGGLFHLITHAFFKALLFLGSGSVIHAAHHEQEMPQYGGLIRKIPVTGITFAIAVLAIAGTPFLSGYYSKDMILAHAGAFGYAAAELHRSGWYWLLFFLPIAIAYVTAFYMTRCWMLTFAGKPRNQHLYDHAREEPIMYVPLIVLAVMSIIGGYTVFGVKDLLNASIKESNAYCSTEMVRSGAPAPYAVFSTYWPSNEPHASVAEAEATDTAAAALTHSEHLHLEGWHKMHAWVGFAWLIGIGAGVLMYLKGFAVANLLMKIPPLRWIHRWLYRRMYFDELYFNVFVAITMGFSRLGAWFDRYIVDGIVNLVAWLVKQGSFMAGANDRFVVDGAVNGVAELSQQIGSAVRAPQTGRIRVYVAVLMAAITVGVAGAIIVVLSN